MLTQAYSSMHRGWPSTEKVIQKIQLPRLCDVYRFLSQLVSAIKGICRPHNSW